LRDALILTTFYPALAVRATDCAEQRHGGREQIMADVGFLATFLFDDMEWCDQSASPPAKARDTHALQFNFYQDADDPEHPHVYKGLFFYTPPRVPGPALSLGMFTGTGCLVAQRHTCEQIVNGLTPFPWVRIVLGLRRQQGSPTDPLAADFRLNIGGSFSYHDAARIRGDFPDLDLALTGGPGPVRQTFETDLVLEPRREQGEEIPESPGEFFHTNFTPYLVLVGPLKGKIFYSRTTVEIPTVTFEQKTGFPP
jgi:hypothetical protein